ncbi:MAG TPA: hypothetical protein VFQ48_10395 [Pseudonocardiaceae bacterium]|nr:hypothetical protein [Pseudonocardiaceae bacterium]
MSTQTSQPHPSEIGKVNAERIVAAYHTARRALIELSNTIHRVVRTGGSTTAEDAAIYTAYDLTYTGADAQGEPTDPLLDYDSADPLILHAAEIKGLLSQLLDRSGDTPSDYTP